MLYFAYGSNLDYTRMLGRCGGAKVVGKGVLRGCKLVFMANNSGRIVANLEEDMGSIVEGVIYDISTRDLSVLDRCEGHPYVYQREDVKVEYKGESISCFTYIMDNTFTVYMKGNSKTIQRHYGIPKREYFQHLLTGYMMFNLPQEELYKAYFNSKREEY